jgi:TfoX/Sxy family transcriptional regulator of competence genes
LAAPYLERLTETIASLDINSGDGMVLEFKHFFSGAALYANGKICATFTPAGFGLKLPRVCRNQLIDVGDGKELRYFDNAPIKKEYVALSQAVMDNPDRLKTLIRQSMEYVVFTG